MIDDCFCAVELTPSRYLKHRFCGTRPYWTTCRSEHEHAGIPFSGWRILVYDLLDQISIRVSDIDAPQFTPCTCSVHHPSTFQDVYAFLVQLVDNLFWSQYALLDTDSPRWDAAQPSSISVGLLTHFIHIFVNNKTQISAARLNRPRLGFKLFSTDMQIDLLVSKTEGMSLHIRRLWRRERFMLHAQYFFIKLDRCIEVFDRQDDVVERLRCSYWSCRHIARKA